MKLDEHSMLLAQAIEQIPSTVIIADLKGNIVYVNPKFTELTGYSREEVLGRNPRILKSNHTTPEEYEELWGTITSGKEWRGEFLNKKKNGEHYWESARISPARDETGKITHFLAVKEDITARKEAEEAAGTAREELEARNVILEAVNKELEAFSYSVSHDLRAPLRHIEGFSEALLAIYIDVLDERGREYLNRMRKAVVHMNELIEDLLKLSRSTRGEMSREIVNLGLLAQSVLNALRQEDPTRDVHCFVDDSVVVDGDPRLLRTAMENLLGNAWKFTRKREKAVIEFGAAKVKGKRVFFVRDNGAGFDRERAGDIFNPFVRLHKKEEFEGTGIGLTTVQRIVHRHGGRVWAESGESEGATFFFTLR